jgi:hypothetical protein
MNRDLLELYGDYLLGAFSYTTITELAAMRGRVEAPGAQVEVRNLADKGTEITARCNLISS